MRIEALGIKACVYRSLEQAHAALGFSPEIDAAGSWDPPLTAPLGDAVAS